MNSQISNKDISGIFSPLRIFFCGIPLQSGGNIALNITKGP